MKLNTSTRKKFRVSNKVKKVASRNRFRLSVSRSSKNIFASEKAKPQAFKGDIKYFSISNTDRF